ncbi:hypothetical protein L3V31_21705 [Vibrio sp. J1-1]|uniref:hypothetical protein n=1 Tax=Vibrio sp. J1-1 TaxID=2912251 RepID=UPI001F41F5B1|nr:hypothetical protein [Vibrio sp. J1-1]MCF7484297.1 hypothetical protein [Vibrio sp. J1-1]
MNKKTMEFLNQPFVLWFMSSVLITFISWQYSEIQKSHSEAKVQQQVLKRANLELRLLLGDVKASAIKTDTLTYADLNAIVLKMQYNAIRESNQYYFPSLQNVMLELDSRTDSEGLRQFQSSIHKHLIVLSESMSRLWAPNVLPNSKVYLYLTHSEKQSLRELAELAELAESIEDYYTKYS